MVDESLHTVWPCNLASGYIASRSPRDTMTER